MKRNPGLHKKLDMILTGKQKRDFCLLIVLITMAAFLELLGVSMLYPFISYVVSPELIKENQFLAEVFRLTGAVNYGSRLLLVAIGLILLYVIKNLFIGFVYAFKNRFIFDNQKEIACRLFREYVEEPYYEHVKKNSASLLRGITSDILDFFTLMMNVILLVSHMLVCLFLLFFLFWKDPVMTAVMSVLLGTYFILFVRRFRKKTGCYGEISKQALGDVYKDVQLTFGGMKEVKSFGLEENHIRKMEQDYSDYSVTYRKYYFGLELPRLILESVCVSAILLLVTFRILYQGDVVGYIPVLGVFAMALFRMFPRITEANECINKISFFMPSLNLLYEDMKELRTMKQPGGSKKDELTLDHELRFQNVSFAYDGGKEVLRQVSFYVPCNSMVAITGASGEGKTTLIDLILGLFLPQKGEILADGVNIQDNLNSFRNLIGYIPQDIFIADDTVRNNILFGLKGAQEYGDKKIWEILTQVDLKETVEEMEQGLDTILGERGSRISGGQKQRLGIARALMISPKLLIMDEATSALDADTEKEVLNAAMKFRGKVTIIIISHRMSSLAQCDYFFHLENGMLNRTSYEALISR